MHWSHQEKVENPNVGAFQSNVAAKHETKPSF